MRTFPALRPLFPIFQWLCAPSRGRLGAVLGVGLALAVAGCSRPAPPQEPVRSVKLLTVGVEALESRLEYAGEVRARVESRIGFRVAGKLVQRQAELGQRVRAGQVLAQLDPQDYQLAADAARAQLAAATTQRDLAAADYQRYAALKEQGFISSAELDRRSASLKAAQAMLDQARAQLSSQGNQATYTRLAADVPGVVTGIEAEPGQVLAAGTPVLRIAQDGPRDAVFAVPEDKVAQIGVGQEMAVRGWSGGAALVGHVREVAASADPATRTYQVKVAIDGAQPPALGATVYAAPRLPGGAGRAVIKLPTTALRQEGQTTAVWVYEPASSTVRSQVVLIAAVDGNAVVVAAGLAPGMQVVATGVHVLAPGQRVMVYKDKYAMTTASQAQGTINKVASDKVAPAAAAFAASAASSAQ